MFWISPECNRGKLKGLFKIPYLIYPSLRSTLWGSVSKDPFNTSWEGLSLVQATSQKVFGGFGRDSQGRRILPFWSLECVSWRSLNLMPIAALVLFRDARSFRESIHQKRPRDAQSSIWATRWRHSMLTCQGSQIPRSSEVVLFSALSELYSISRKHQ